MNNTEKNILMAVAVASFGAFLYARESNKKQRPIKFLGLNADHSVKFFAGLSVLSVGVLLVNKYSKKIA